MRADAIVGLSLVLAMLSLAPGAVSAAPNMRAIGGGTGTFAADLDGDGDIDGSQFGFTVLIARGGGARGHFECLMAGGSDILGLALMAVEAKITAGAILTDGSVTIDGVAAVNLGGGEIFRGVAIRVRLVAGGPGTGSIQLTVVGAFDGVPGDAAPGNGNYDLPPESVSTGSIVIEQG